MRLLQADLLEWLCALGLPQYHKQLVSSGYDSMGLVADLTWEELQEIGVNKLGEDRPGPSGWASVCLRGPPRCFVLRRDEGHPLQPQLTLPRLSSCSQVIRRSSCWG